MGIGSGGGTPSTPRARRRRDGVGVAEGSANGKGVGAKTPTSARGRILGQIQTPTSAAAGRAAGAGKALGDTPGSVGAPTGSAGGRRSTRLPPRAVDANAAAASVVLGSAAKLSFKNPSLRKRLSEHAVVIEGDVDGGLITASGTGNGADGESESGAAAAADQELVSLSERLEHMAAAVSAAFDLPDASVHIIRGCEAVLSVRGWDDSIPEPEMLLESGKRAASNAENDSPGRGRKRRRLSHATSTVTSRADGVTEGKITRATLLPMMAALALYTVFTIRAKAVTGDVYDSARDKAISALMPLYEATEHEVDAEQEEAFRRGVAAFLKAAHTEGWLEMEWTEGVRDETARIKALREEDGLESGQVDEDVDMGEGEEAEAVEDAEMGINAADQAVTAPFIIEDALQPLFEPPPHPENQDQVAEQPHLRTPRKSVRQIKTPLRRKEKHAPRPSLSGSKTLGRIGEAGETPNASVSGRAGLKSGLGTMFQDAVDWLSAERCAGYEDWEGWIRAELERIEGQGGSVDTIMSVGAEV